MFYSTIYSNRFAQFNPIALRKAKIVVYNFGLSECSRVNEN